jgi:DNA-binding NarL/FixJ family response regulator
MKTPIRLIIADDHALFRGGLKSLLRRQRDMHVVAEVESAGALMPALDNTRCDILLLDLQMERWALDDIRPLAARTKVLVLTASESVENALTAMRLGARAVVQKRFAVQTLIEAIHAVADGLVWMPPALQTEMAGQWGASASRQLTGREAEIVRHVATGLRNAEIGERLSITEATVKTHLNNIFDKLQLRDRVELAVYALRHGLAAGKTGAAAEVNTTRRRS